MIENENGVWCLNFIWMGLDKNSKSSNFKDDNTLISKNLQI